MKKIIRQQVLVSVYDVHRNYLVLSSCCQCGRVFGNYNANKMYALNFGISEFFSILENKKQKKNILKQMLFFMKMIFADINYCSQIVAYLIEYLAVPMLIKCMHSFLVFLKFHKSEKN